MSTPRTDSLRLVIAAGDWCKQSDCTEAALSHADKLEIELSEAKKQQPINTNYRLFDLVRYMRSELHEQNLITDAEYGWLCSSEMAMSPEGGSPSPRRLEDYDQLRAKIERAQKALNVAVGLCNELIGEECFLASVGATMMSSGLYLTIRDTRKTCQDAIKGEV